MARTRFMENNPSITPEMVPETNGEKKFLSITGVQRYSHLMSSMTNIVIGAFLLLSGGTFFVLQLIELLTQGFVFQPVSFMMYTILTLRLLVFTIVQMGMAFFSSVLSFKLRKNVLKGDYSNQLSLVKGIWILAIIQLIASVVLLVMFIMTSLILNGLNVGATTITNVPSPWYVALFLVNTFLAFSYMLIIRGNLKAIEKGADYYEHISVQPIGALESFMISIGNGIKSIGLFLFNFVLLFVKAFINIFIGLYKIVLTAVKKIIQFAKKFYFTFTTNSFRTKLSYIFMGFGHFFMQRPFKAILYLVLEVAYIVYMVLPNSGGIYWLSKFDNLGDRAFTTIDECGIIGFTLENCPPEDIIQRTVFLDNSMLIALYSVATIIITVAFFVIFWLSIKGVAKADEKYTKALNDYHKAVALEKENFDMNASRGMTSENTDSELEEELLASSETAEKAKGDVFVSSIKFVNPLPTLKDEFRALLNERFHISTLTVPTITITIFTVLPLIFMILLAFTNYSGQVGPPNSLFKWVGLQTFTRLFSSVGGSSFSKAFGDILQWTFIWAFFATFSNYILGMILAMIINRRGLHLKKLWRTVFVITIAVPQFVTLLLMSRLLNKYGPINETLLQLGWIKQHIEFLTDPMNAKISVILVNVWVGVPYTMLITSGILMNIPSDLYESARIDGAGPFAQFTKITLPYMLFVTGPYLITQFIGNINNFNVIFFLTGGGPSAQLAGVQYGKTDILVTWLYSLTVGGAQQEYAIGSALGIFIFAISAFITLALYSKTSAATQEGDFA